MNVELRLTRPLYELAMKDLERPHPFAFERVGFFHGRVSAHETVARVYFTSYEPVPDERYVQDESVGARIDATAIRSALQRALSDTVATFHVHVHGHRGRPGFSRVDHHELSRLVPSFVAVASPVPHGGIVLSQDNGHATAWYGAGAPVEVSSISVVGFPVLLWRRS